MPTFVFKKHLEPRIFKEFLEPICIKTSTHYVINYETLKRAKYNTHYENFIALLRPYYYPSKQHYLDRSFEYKRFLSILRQICTYNNFVYTSTTVYNRSKASLEYKIYYTRFCDENIQLDTGTGDDASKEAATLSPK